MLCHNRSLNNGLLVFLCLVLGPGAYGQKNFNGPPMFLNVNAIRLDMKKINGEGQFTTQYSWMLTGNDREQTEVWYYPQDQWHSQLLYQIFNPVAHDDSGFVNQYGAWQVIPPVFTQMGYISPGINDFSWEIRRYRPPEVYVDEVPLFREYRWETDPTLKADMVAIWEDVLPYWGFRTHIEVYAFSNPNHDNYLIWKATYRFTGETKRPIQNPGPDDFFPDQTIRLWWPLAFSFGPSKAGEYAVLQGSFAFEGEDDLDSWFPRESQLVADRARDTLKVAYYWDYKFKGAAGYPNGSLDDSGDPDRQTGNLLAPQIPGYALLHCAVNSFNPADDDLSQPYALPHATILDDLWGRRDPGLRNTYIGNDKRGRFPLDPITEGWMAPDSYQKGPMRFVTIGPYQLRKDSATDSYDEINAVYAIGVGSLSWQAADSVGKAWFAGEISDSAKNAVILTGRDSLFQALDRAYWAWDRGLDIPDPPPPPDLSVLSGPRQNIVSWSYPDADYFKDPDTGIDDWQAWRVYRKRGAAMVNDPDDHGTGERWQLIYETQDRNETTCIDEQVDIGVSYYYAVTAIDNGSQNTDGLFPGQPLESSRYANRTSLPAIPFKEGLATSDRVRVVPNPVTTKAGELGFPGDPDRVLFTNLPYQCRLHIFTETGDQVLSLDHLGTDQEIWNQRTDDNQYVASGVYVLTVTEAESVDGRELPDQFVKFVIVR